MKKLKFLRWVFLLLVLALLFSSAYQAVASAADLRRYPAPGQLIDVGGHRLHIYCLGQGEPTVVMEAGLSGWSTDWILVQPEVEQSTRVCTYDRAGYGWSDPGPLPRDSREVASELHTLLSRSGTKGDIILVGHSQGGLFVQFKGLSRSGRRNGFLSAEPVGSSGGWTASPCPVSGDQLVLGAEFSAGLYRGHHKSHLGRTADRPGPIGYPAASHRLQERALHSPRPAGSGHKQHPANGEYSARKINWRSLSQSGG